MFLFVFCGWGNNGWGNRGGNSGGASSDYVLATDFASIERKIDGVNNGLCDGFYAMNTGMLNGFAGLQNNVNQGFAGLNTALVAQGYETRLGVNDLSSQLADCCCKTQGAIKDAVTQNIMNTNSLATQIERCCCDARYEAAQQNCATLQAIDKVGDRVIDYLAAKEAQELRDENFALRLSASQCAQNNYLVNQLRPAPVPAFAVPAPWFMGNCNNGCGCGNF